MFIIIIIIKAQLSPMLETVGSVVGQKLPWTKLTRYKLHLDKSSPGDKLPQTKAPSKAVYVVVCTSVCQCHYRYVCTMCVYVYLFE